jgi:hypothetical protein
MWGSGGGGSRGAMDGGTMRRFRGNPDPGARGVCRHTPPDRGTGVEPTPSKVSVRAKAARPQEGLRVPAGNPLVCVATTRKRRMRGGCCIVSPPAVPSSIVAAAAAVAQEAARMERGSEDNRGARSQGSVEEGGKSWGRRTPSTAAGGGCKQSHLALDELSGAMGAVGWFGLGGKGGGFDLEGLCEQLRPWLDPETGAVFGGAPLSPLRSFADGCAAVSAAPAQAPQQVTHSASPMPPMPPMPQPPPREKMPAWSGSSDEDLTEAEVQGAEAHSLTSQSTHLPEGHFALCFGALLPGHYHLS